MSDTRRIFLKDYSAAECASMDAGPLMDWLVAQARKIKPERRDSLGWCVIDDGDSLDWWNGDNQPRSGECQSALDHSGTNYLCASTDGNAALRVLRWMNGAILKMTHTGPDRWTCEGNIHIETVFNGRIWADGPTPHVAICRAALALAKSREGGTNDK